MAINITIPTGQNATTDYMQSRGQAIGHFLGAFHPGPQVAPHENHLIDNAFGFTQHTFAPTDIITGGGLYHGADVPTGSAPHG